MPTYTNEKESILQDSSFKNRWWRLNNIYHIIDKSAKSVVCKWNVAQKYLYDNLWYSNIILKARQLGYTTAVRLLFLDECLFRTNQNAVIIADTEDNAEQIFKAIKYAWQHIDQRIKQAFNLKLVRETSQELAFSNESSIRVATSIRGGTVQMLHVSEFGKICKFYPEKAKEIINSSFPAVVPDGKIVIESTAMESIGDFYEMCQQYKGKNPKTPREFRFFFSAWWQNPEYRMKIKVIIPKELEKYFIDLEKLGITLDDEQKWWYVMMKNVHKDDMKREYPSYADEAFETSGNKMFDMDIIREMMIRNKGVNFVRRDNGDLKIFEDYIKGERYGLGGDVSEGIGRDSSTMAVINYSASKVVATYKNNNIEPDRFAYKIRELGEMYGKCLVAPERNNHGFATLSVLRTIYPNIFIQQKESKLENVTMDMLGWATNLSPLDIETPILTPIGWKRMKELSIGDKVIGSNGKSIKVLGIYPQGKLQAYNLKTSDGTLITCSENHLWPVKRKWNKNGKYQILKTSEIEPGTMFWIPLVSSVELKKRKLPIDPYFLGLLLGDGSFGRTICFSTSDTELVEYISKVLPYPIRILPDKSGHYSYTISRPRNGFGKTPNELQLKLKELGLRGTRSHTKFIPDDYKISSKEDRLALLRGLMDTDGCVTTRQSSLRFASVSLRLAEDIREIVLSLGGYAKIIYCKNKYNGYYLVTLQLNKNPFLLKRKAQKYKSDIKRIRRRDVIEIEKTNEMKEMICISVDSKDGLYVIKDYLLTHNTKPEMMYDLAYAINNKLLEIPDLEALEEFRQFDKEMVNVKVKGYDENITQHFDLLQAIAIAWQMRKYAMITEPTALSEKKKTWFGEVINDNRTKTIEEITYG